MTDDDIAIVKALLNRLSANAARLAWPDVRLHPGDETSVAFMGTVGDPDFVAHIAVHRGPELLRHIAYSGWDGVSFLLRWADKAIE
ncbi:hypothetical protein ACFSKW_14250 [Nonomuraea mangrovi]|uniref:GNAT family N-acetyltransferase n=1 Tax=Nonomuraea mangrovi TaxID=2316207 RepID=A0ABW4SWH3_9ACTN